MAKPKADENGLLYVDSKGKLTTADNAVAQYIEADARSRGLLTDEPEEKAATVTPQEPITPTARGRRQ